MDLCDKRMYMKRLFVVVLLAFLFIPFSSCKKTIDKKTENYILGIMTDGHWYVYNFTDDNLDITYNYYGYEFQFYDNRTVDLISNGTVLVKGTWTEDINLFTITANFPTTDPDLLKLNNVWKITDSYINAVFAEATKDAVNRKMELVKK